MRKFSEKDFEFYINLWGRGGPNWKIEEHKYYLEQDRDWTQVSRKSKKKESVFKRLSFPKETPKPKDNSVFNRIEFPNDKFIRSDNGDKWLYHPNNGLSYANAVINGNNVLHQSWSEPQSKGFLLPGLLPFLKFPSFPIKAWPEKITLIGLWPMGRLSKLGMLEFSRISLISFRQQKEPWPPRLLL
jgi:hypothetical protein